MTRRWLFAVGLVIGLTQFIPVSAGLGSDVGKTVQRRIGAVEVGQPRSYKGLTVVPLTASDIGDLNYLTLDEAVKRGAIRLLEKGSGEVNTVKAESLTNKRIFIMDGEEIVGAKQNRILNSSVMIGPKRVVELPVSCVEHGRWTASTPEFRSEGTQLFGRARQSNQMAVAKNRAAQPSRPAESDQQMIWDSVADKRASLKVGGGSGAMYDAYVKYRGSVDEYVRHFSVVRGQVGALFAIDGEIIGADIFDQHETLEKVFPKLVRSYALDAIDRGARASIAENVDTKDARQFLDRALKSDVKVRDYASADEGRDVRLTSSRISSAGLVVSATPVHVALFAAVNAARPQTNPGSNRLRPPSERRNQINRSNRGN